APFDIYPLSLHDALPIYWTLVDGIHPGWRLRQHLAGEPPERCPAGPLTAAIHSDRRPKRSVQAQLLHLGPGLGDVLDADLRPDRSEEHTSELQSQSNLVC